MIRAPRRRGPLLAALDLAFAGLFVLAIAPFLVMPADWAVRAFGAVGRRLLPMSPAAERIRDNRSLLGVTDGAEAEDRLAAGVGDNFGRVLAEYIRMPDIARRRDRRRVAGLDHLRRAAEDGRGVVLVSAHYGNWEAVRLAALDAEIEVGILYRSFNNAGFDRLSRLRIGRAGQPVMHKGREGARALLAHLRQGGAMLVLIDQRQSKSPALPFLGRPALTATGVAAVCLRTKAAMIPARAVRAADGLSFDIEFEAPIPPGRTEAMTIEANRRIGRWIEQHPEQWFWLHKRWSGVKDAETNKAL